MLGRKRKLSLEEEGSEKEEEEITESSILLSKLQSPNFLYQLICKHNDFTVLATDLTSRLHRHFNLPDKTSAVNFLTFKLHRLRICAEVNIAAFRDYDNVTVYLDAFLNDVCVNVLNEDEKNVDWERKMTVVSLLFASLDQVN